MQSYHLVVFIAVKHAVVSFSGLYSSHACSRII